MKRVMKGDNISRSALIRQIEIDADGSPGWYGDTWQFIKTIAKMPSTDKWIPCSERLPEIDYDNGTVVFATVMSEHDKEIRWVRELVYDENGAWCYPTGETYDQIVVAWMPKPEPYKGSGYERSMRMIRDLTEMNKLEDYLKANGFEYQREDEDAEPMDKHQIIVFENGVRSWDVICHYGSYGGDEGLLEGMGDLFGPDVDGYLTAEDVIKKIEEVRS